MLRSIAAIQRCDVALLLIDAQDGVTEQDTKIAGIIHDEGKAAVIVNKWDTLEKDTNTLEKTKSRSGRPEVHGLLPGAVCLGHDGPAGQHHLRPGEGGLRPGQQAHYDGRAERRAERRANRACSRPCRADGGSRSITAPSRASARPPSCCFVNDPKADALCLSSAIWRTISGRHLTLRARRSASRFGPA